MPGQKGVTIAIVALMLTICAGYLVNFEDTTTSRTTYNDLANLDAIMYANSTRGQSADTYNTVYNVTGWTGADIPRSGTANEYILKPRTVEYSDAPRTVNFVNDYTVIKSTSASSHALFKGFDTTTNGVKYQGGETYTNGGALRGGLSQSFNYGSISNRNYESTSINLYLNGGQQSTLYFIDLAEVIPADLDYRVTYEPTKYLINPTLTADFTSTDVWLGTFAAPAWSWTINYNGTTNYNVAYFQYSTTTEKWNAYNSAGEMILNNVRVGIYSTSATVTLDIKEPVEIVPEYADNTRAPVVNNGAVWSNYAENDTLVNARVTFIIEGARASITATDTAGNTATVGITANNMGRTRDYIVTLDSIDHVAYFRPCNVNYGANEGEILDYTLIGTTYTQPLNVDNIASISFNDLRLFGTIGMEFVYCYIISTDIFTDPRGVMWNDFNVNLYSYFPQDINALRVKFNGYVSVGDSLEIGGETYTVINKKITVPTIDEFGAVTYSTHGIDGLCIDYIDGAITLVFADGVTVPLGQHSNKTIHGAGAWYFSANAYAIGEETTTVKEWSPEWSLSANGTALTFVGLIGIGCAIALYVRRDTWGVVDWAVIALSAFIAFSLMVV